MNFIQFEEKFKLGSIAEITCVPTWLADSWDASLPIPFMQKGWNDCSCTTNNWEIKCKANDGNY